MSYHGYEIFFQTLGNADSIFVRHHSQGLKTNILIDGGRKSHVEAVRGFLRDRGESEIHHLVCSHHHDDHAGGLVELVRDKTLTINQAWVHTEELMADVVDLGAYAARGYRKLVETLQASKETQVDLVAALQQRGVPISSPWSGQWLGPLMVLSPTQPFYQEQMARIKDECLAKALNDRYLRRQLNSMRGLMVARQMPFEAKAREDEQEEEGALGGEPTSPENEVSTVLCLPWDGSNNARHYILLTADAGTEALDFVMQVSKETSDLLRNIPWMQLPHHGSRRNLNEDLLDYFNPRTALVSAEGSLKHPSKKLVVAVKSRRGSVYSTHYPNKEEGKGSWLRQSLGIVPEMSTTPAIPLWSAKE